AQDEHARSLEPAQLRQLEQRLAVGAVLRRADAAPAAPFGLAARARRARSAARHTRTGQGPPTSSNALRTALGLTNTARSNSCRRASAARAAPASSGSRISSAGWSTGSAPG